MSHIVHTVLGCALFWASLPAFADTTTISTGPFLITEPGVYHVTQDLTCPTGGITITATDVELHLDGHTLDGVGTGFIGVDVFFGSNDRVFGSGTVTNFRVGIGLGDNAQCTVVNVTATNNRIGIALQVSSDNTLTSNTALGNGVGIQVIKRSNNNILKANHADGNQFAGIDVGGGSSGNIAQANQIDGNQHGIFVQVSSGANIFQANKAHGNSVFDLEDGNPGCDANTWKSNSFDTANQPCIQ